MKIEIEGKVVYSRIKNTFVGENGECFMIGVIPGNIKKISDNETIEFAKVLEHLEHIKSKEALFISTPVSNKNGDINKIEFVNKDKRELIEPYDIARDEEVIIGVQVYQTANKQARDGLAQRLSYVVVGDETKRYIDSGLSSWLEDKSEIKVSNLVVNDDTLPF